MNTSRQIETMKSREFALTDWCAKISQAWALSRPHGDFGGSFWKWVVTEKPNPAEESMAETITILKIQIE